MHALGCRNFFTDCILSIHNAATYIYRNVFPTHAHQYTNIDLLSDLKKNAEGRCFQTNPDIASGSSQSNLHLALVLMAAEII